MCPSVHEFLYFHDRWRTDLAGRAAEKPLNKFSRTPFRALNGRSKVWSKGVHVEGNHALASVFGHVDLILPKDLRGLDRNHTFTPLPLLGSLNLGLSLRFLRVALVALHGRSTGPPRQVGHSCRAGAAEVRAPSLRGFLTYVVGVFNQKKANGYESEGPSSSPSKGLNWRDLLGAMEFGCSLILP